MKKKIISFALVFVMLSGILTVLSGCKGGGSAADDDDKEVILKWAFDSPEQTDYREVQDAINEELHKHMPTTSVELLLDANLNTKWSMWMAGGIPVDIVYSGFRINTTDQVLQEAYLPIDDLVNKHAPNLKKEWDGIFRDDYMAATYSGELYGIPVIQYHVNDTVTLSGSAEMFEEFMDIDAVIAEGNKNPKTTRRMYELLDDYLNKAFASGKADTSSVAPLIMIKRIYETLCKRGYQFISNQADCSICYDPYSDKPEIIDFHTTDEFKTFVEYAEKWYAAGFVSKDIFTGGSAGNRAYMLDCTNIFGHSEKTEESGGANQKDEFSEGFGPNGLMIKRVSIDSTENMYRGFTQLGSVGTQSIPFTSENPARAIKFIDFLHTEEARTLLNIICYGIEGKHWDRVGDPGEHHITPKFYPVQGSGSSPYGIANWCVSTMFFVDVTYPAYDYSTVEYAKRYYNEIRPNAKKTALYGFSFDITPVQTEFQQLQGVNQEYEIQVYSGAMKEKTQETLVTLIEKAKAAGQDKILDELQKQANAYVTKK